MAVKHIVKEGENLNKIAQNYGYSNYKEAGVSSVPSGNFDLIRPGEEITLNSYNPDTASTIKTGSPVVSSKDRSGEYDKLSSDIAGRETPIEDIPDTGLSDKGGKTGTGGKTDTTTTTTPESTGDAVYDAYLKSRADETAKNEAWAEEQRREVEKLLPQTLAAIDANYKSAKTNIEATYEKLLDSQIKINAVDLGRVKAYGVQNGGQYMPLEFTKAVSKQERISANEIARLEGERNSLIAQAKAARQEGRVGAMRQSMEDLQKIEKNMRERVDFLLKEVEKRYEITEKAREKKEAERLEAVNKAMKRAAFVYLDEFDEALDPEKSDALIKKIIKDSGGLLNETDYYDIYSSMQVASTEKKDLATKSEKDRLDIESKKASIANTYDQINKRKDGNADEDEESNTWADINEAFTLANTDGNPVVGEDGYANPQFFNELMTAAKEDKVSRADFLAEYGHLVNTASDRIGDYKLTKKEQDALLGL